MQNFKNLIEKRTSLAVIGLGYVGMPLAIAFADHINVTGFDLNKEKISLYKSGIDPTNEDRLRINCLSGGYRRYLYSNLGKRVWFNVRY